MTANKPLADLYRPTSFDEMVGQAHIINILKSIAACPQSVIFYGPPGTGKTTAALLLAKSSGKPFFKLNAVNASSKEVKEIADSADDNGVILYLDEIQYFNKKQQQSLLPYIESGKLILIAATTENPYHDIYGALLSRCAILEFKPLTPEDIARRLSEALRASVSPLTALRVDVIGFVAKIASGDVRRAFNTIELISANFTNYASVTIDDVRSLLPSALMAGFDMHGDNHYAYIAALQKSIRGSDPDAAVFYLAKLLEGGDIISPSRRMFVMASEDVGLAAPEIVSYVLSCVQSAQMLGLPEAYYPLTQAALLLALAPKSNSVGCFNEAREDIKMGCGTVVPPHISSECPPNYIYPHNYPMHWCPQQYLPDDIKYKKYYEPGDNAYEQKLSEYWKYVKNQTYIK